MHFTLFSVVGVMAMAMIPSTIANDLDLTDANFESELENADLALVMFYAPWCGHCKRMKPEFTKSAGDLAKNDPPVTLAKVDCTEAGKDTCSRFGVSGYPTLKIFRNGELASDYQGPREAAGITKFMKAQAGPSSKEVKTEEELKKLLERPEVVVVSFLEAGAERDAFLKAADALRESVAFGHFTGKAGSKKGVVLYRPKIMQTKMEESELAFEGKVTKDALSTWINENYHGLVGHRTVDNRADFKNPLVIAYFGVDYVKNVKGTNYWRNRVMKVAKAHLNLNFAISNKDDFMQETGEFGITAIVDDKPRVVVMDKAAKKYVMNEEFSVENLEAFIKDFEAGKVEAYIKSEDVPANNDGPVKVAVARNFEELVEKSEKDVLIEFYAPWCGHCKKLTPIYEELGEAMKGENVEIVKMDATANDVPSGYDVRGFPTLFWLPAKSKKPESYQGGRELDDFVKFISEKAGSELNGYDRKGKQKKTEL